VELGSETTRTLVLTFSTKNNIPYFLETYTLPVSSTFNQMGKDTLDDLGIDRKSG
jgi:hypothetical protein